MRSRLPNPINRQNQENRSYEKAWSNHRNWSGASLMFLRLAVSVDRKENYDSLPTERPKWTFIDALDQVLAKSIGSLLADKESDGLYVRYSKHEMTALSKTQRPSR